MKKETIETIRFALRFLAGVNEAIYHSSNSSKRIEQALKDVRKDNEALDDFESFVVRYVLRLHLFEKLGGI